MFHSIIEIFKLFLTKIKEYEPVSRSEGRIVVHYADDVWELTVYSNILFNGSKVWTGKDFDKVTKRAYKEILARMEEELAFPRDFLVDVD